MNRTNRRADPAPLPPSKQKRTWLLIGSMFLSIAVIAGLAFWDSERQSEATLDDFAQEQAILASSVAADLSNRLLSIPPDQLRGDPLRPLAGFLAGLHRLERAGSLVLLVAPPDGLKAQVFYTTRGQRITSVLLGGALRAQSPFSLSVPRQEAAQLGLPARMALAGLAQADGGTWWIAAVSSVRRERDRNQRARWRAVLGVLLASGLVLAFGGVALAIQRRELQMEQSLAVADLRRQRDERLIRASKAATMGTLALGITHELSTPLGVITVRTEQLLARLGAGQGSDERAARNLQVILDQTHHIGQIVRGFLGLVRGHNPPTEPLPPADVVRGAVALIEHRFAKSGVRLSTAIPEELPLIRGELRLLEHALVNLLLNACDACAENGQVDVYARAEGGDIIFSVEDNGVGISAADAERALEPFFTTKSAEEGTGLGLAIAQEIVKNHRGELELAPRAAGGTCATIHIPIWQGVPHAE